MKHVLLRVIYSIPSGSPAMNLVYVDGIGMTRFGKSNLDLKSLITEAGKQALASSKCPPPQAIFIGAQNPEEFTGTGNIGALTADALGFWGVPSIRIETASSSGAAVFSVAYTAVASGVFGTVLVLAGEKMTDLPTARATRILAEVIENGEKEAGASMAALAAMAARAYADRFNLSPQQFELALAGVAMKSHANGALNPLAQFQKPLTFEDYKKSKFVAEPLRLYDCSPMTDGAAALLLTREKTDIRVAGIGQGTDTLAVRRRSSLTSFVATRIAAKQAYEMAGIGPREISFAEIHDAFTMLEIIDSEDLGFFDEGTGWKAIEDGTTRINGKFPINPSGGLKSRGHPVGASGLAQIVECVRQMRGQVDPRRQVAATDRALTHSIGGFGNNNFVAILEKESLKPAPDAGSYTLPISVAPPAGREDSVAAETDGILESFTLLHMPPEGFPAPLLLGFVRTFEGPRLLARASQLGTYRMHEKVRIVKDGNSWVFMKMDLISRLRYYVRRAAKKLQPGKKLNSIIA